MFARDFTRRSPCRIGQCRWIAVLHGRTPPAAAKSTANRRTHRNKRESMFGAAVPPFGPSSRRVRNGPSYGAVLPSSTIFAVSFDHSCSPPQCGQAILPTNAGIMAKDARSISMPVSISFPVTSQGVNILGMGVRSPSDARHPIPNVVHSTIKFDIAATDRGSARSCCGRRAQMNGRRARCGSGS